MLGEDAPDLADHCGMVQARMPAMDEQLRGGALEMRARVRDDPVGCAGAGWFPKVRIDRMAADRWINSEVAGLPDTKPVRLLPRPILTRPVARHPIAARAVSGRVKGHAGRGQDHRDSG